MTINEFWAVCQQQLQETVSSHQFEQWLAPLTATEDETQWIIYTTGHFAHNIIKKQFWTQILEIQRHLAPESKPLVLHIASSTHTSTTVQKEIKPLPSESNTPIDTDATDKKQSASTSVGKKNRSNAKEILANRLKELDNPNNNPQQSPATTNTSTLKNESSLSKKTSKENLTKLLPSYTFDTLVIGKGNEIAVASGYHIAENPGAEYNPFFLYGSPGLGKTHLVQAIAHQTCRNHPGTKVIYIQAIHYAQDLIQAALHKTFDQFKQKYQHYDLLILDDIQQIAGKERTMEEFFYLFNHFHASRRQIILTCDQLPENIQEMDERLRTRFGSGLTLPLKPPELEMRVNILYKKAEAARIDLNDDAALYIAKHIKGDVRSLEGALTRVAATSRFQNRPIDITLASESLKDIIKNVHRIITIDMIMDEVSKYYRINVSDLMSKKRPKNIVQPRQIAMSLAKELTSLSLPAIGQSFGGRDHSTVLHAIEKVVELRQTYPEIEQDYQKLLILLKN